MVTTNELKDIYCKNFSTLKLYLTDIVAAEESGFGSQDIASQGNWLIGRILVQRLSLLDQLDSKSMFRLDWITEELETYTTSSFQEGSKHFISYKRLLSDLVSSQNALVQVLEEKELDDEVIQSIAMQESEFVLELTRHQRQNGNTGIY